MLTSSEADAIVRISVEIGKMTFFWSRSRSGPGEKFLVPVPVPVLCLLKFTWLRKFSQNSWFFNAYNIYIYDLESMLLPQPIRMYQNSESARVGQLFLEIMPGYFSARFDLHLYIYFSIEGERGYGWGWARVRIRVRVREGGRGWGWVRVRRTPIIFTLPAPQDIYR